MQFLLKAMAASDGTRKGIVEATFSGIVVPENESLTGRELGIDANGDVTALPMVPGHGGICRSCPHAPRSVSCQHRRPADLPDTVQRYLHFMGVVGRSRDWSFQARFTGRFRREPDHSWMPCQAWQYNTASPIARVFHMSARFLHLVPMVARDTYIGGHG
jgi:hypothetical protein